MRWETPAIQTFSLCRFSGDKRESVSHVPQHSPLQRNGSDVLDSSPSLTSDPVLQDTIRPHPCPTLSSFPIADELILLRSDQSLAVSLNTSARHIWECCDGHHTVAEVSKELQERYGSYSDVVPEDVSLALDIFRQLHLLQFQSRPIAQRNSVKFVVGIEDKTYFHWQLPILMESLRHKLPVGWNMIVVVCNNHVPLSETLSDIFHTYGVTYITTTNHPMNENMDFSDGDDFYVPLNRIEALNAVADHIQSDDLVCLLETDIFVYRDLNLEVFPTTNTLVEDWLIGQDLFFVDGQNQRGVKLQKLLESFDCPHTFKPGGVLLFLTGDTVKNKKFIQDCFRFTQILYLMGKIHQVPKVWIAEMPCFALALTVNGIPYNLTNTPEFMTRNGSAPTIPPGTFYHYYRDLNDGRGGAFYQSQWYKHQFFKTNMLQENLSHYVSQATSPHEKYFFELVKKAKGRLYVSNT